MITYGLDYRGRPHRHRASKAGMEQPVYYWDPVIAPSGVTFYTGSAFPSGAAICWSAPSAPAGSCG